MSDTETKLRERIAQLERDLAEADHFIHYSSLDQLVYRIGANYDPARDKAMDAIELRACKRHEDRLANGQYEAQETAH